MSDFHVKVIFSRPKKWKLFSWLIRKRINKPYSHVAIAVYLKPLEIFDVYEAAYGDVHLIGEQKFKKRNTIVKEYDLFMDRMAFMSSLKYLKLQLEKSYSEMGAIASTFVFLRKLNIGNNNDKSFICSELAAKYLESTGMVNLKSDADYITPDMFEEILQEFYHNKVHFHED